MTTYAAIINIPGYLPQDDDPPTFDEVADAWEWLISELERNDDQGFPAAWLPADRTDPHGPQDRSPTALALEAAQARALVGTVYGPSPGDDPDEVGTYDLGLAYSVVEVEVEVEPEEETP